MTDKKTVHTREDIELFLVDMTTQDVVRASARSVCGRRRTKSRNLNGIKPEDLKNSDTSRKLAIIFRQKETICIIA